MLDFIEISVAYKNADVKEIFKSISTSGKYKNLPFISDFEKENFELDFSKYKFKSIKNANVFSPYCRELLCGFFSMLGKSDTDGQVLNCRTYKEFFRRELQKTENNENTKIKTATSLLFSVAFTALVIIL